MHQSRRVRIAIIVALVLATASSAAGEAKRVLRVCADPNNAPLSSERGRSIEGDVARVIARGLGARIEYTWWAQRRGFLRNTLAAMDCDVVIGIPAGADGPVRTTAPYYRSTYAFVTRAKDKLAITSFDDPKLRALRIGVQLVGDDGANPPPIHALARRGIVDNVTGYNIVGDYTKESPAAGVMRALERGDIDVAVAWGPIAGGYARRSKTKLVLSPITAAEPGLPMAFSIAMGVRKGDEALAGEIDRILVARRAEILRVLDAWRVPRLALSEAP